MQIFLSLVFKDVNSLSGICVKFLDKPCYNFKLKSVNVTSLFTNVPLDFMIDLILKKIYNQNEVNTNVPRLQMRDLFLLCTKNVHFSFNEYVYTQAHGVAMGWPLGPVLAGIFMVELEGTILPTFERTYESMAKACR